MTIDWNTVIASGLAAFAGGAASFLIAWLNSISARQHARTQALETEWNSKRMLLARQKVEPLLNAFLETPSGDIDGFLAHCRTSTAFEEVSAVLHHLENASVLYQNGMLYNAEAVIILGRYYAFWKKKLSGLKVDDKSEWVSLMRTISKTPWE